MAVLDTLRCVGENGDVHLSDLDLPVGGADVEARGDGGQLDQVVKSVFLVVV